MNKRRRKKWLRGTRRSRRRYEMYWGVKVLPALKAYDKARTLFGPNASLFIDESGGPRI